MRKAHGIHVQKKGDCPTQPYENGEQGVDTGVYGGFAPRPGLWLKFVNYRTALPQRRQAARQTAKQSRVQQYGQPRPQPASTHSSTPAITQQCGPAEYVSAAPLCPPIAERPRIRG